MENFGAEKKTQVLVLSTKFGKSSSMRGLFPLVASMATARPVTLQPSDGLPGHPSDAPDIYLPRMFAEARHSICAGTVGSTCSHGPLCKSSCKSYDSWLYIPYQGNGGMDDRLWMLSRAALVATSLCARLATSGPSIQLPPKHNNGSTVDNTFWWDR